MIKSVSIVGCGWFGLPLAQALVASGVKVKGSKRTQEQAQALSSHGIQGFQLDLDRVSPDRSASDHREASQGCRSDCLVVNIPPGFRKEPGAYLRRLKTLKGLMGEHDYRRIIFVSTTGVYPAEQRLMSEDDALAHSQTSEKLLQAESVFGELPNSCIVRFAGLVGPKRHPGRFLSGKTGVSGADAPVNIVHLNDCILAVSRLIFAENPGSVYNVCAPLHPTRKAFYAAAAADLGLPAPEFTRDGGSGKTIDGEKLMSDLGFEYQFCDPLDMLAACAGPKHD